jgi:integrase/recombinase XerD
MIAHVQAWLEALRVRNCTAETIRTYHNRLKPFVAFCAAEDVRDMALLDKDLVRRYWRSMQTSPKGYSVHALGVHCRALKSFCGYLKGEGYLSVNPADALAHPDSGYRLPKRAPTHTQVMALLAVPDVGEPFGLRDRAMMEVLYSSGLRVGECVALSVFDVDLQGGTVRVNEGKGRKDRDVPLGIEATRWLRRYMGQVRPLYAARAEEPTDALWLGRRGNAPTTLQVQWMFRKYRKGVDAQGVDLTPHGMRRALATGMLSHGADLGSIKGILGHARIETTARYAQALAVDVKQTHAKTHPRQRSTETEANALPRLRRRKNLYARTH